MDCELSEYEKYLIDECEMFYCYRPTCFNEEGMIMSGPYVDYFWHQLIRFNYSVSDLDKLIQAFMYETIPLPKHEGLFLDTTEIIRAYMNVSPSYKILVCASKEKSYFCIRLIKDGNPKDLDDGIDYFSSSQHDYKEFLHEYEQLMQMLRIKTSGIKIKELDDAIYDAFSSFYGKTYFEGTIAICRQLDMEDASKEQPDFDSPNIIKFPINRV